METRPAKGEFKAGRCPACGASITVSRSSSHRRKVQCPKCRDIVTLGPAEPLAATNPTDSAAMQVAELWLKFARLETLDGRIAALENITSQLVATNPTDAAAAQVAELWLKFARLETLEGRIIALEKAATGAEPASAEEPASPRKLKWVPCDPVQSQTFSPELEEALLHNLRTFEPYAITIQTNFADAAARQRAEWLRSIFQGAKWIVHGPQEAPAEHQGHGLVFAVGAVPLPDAAAATLLAMTAAGFAIAPSLDLNLKRDEAALIVG